MSTPGPPVPPAMTVACLIELLKQFPPGAPVIDSEDGTPISVVVRDPATGAVAIG